jgi:hypothetical protein
MKLKAFSTHFPLVVFPRFPAFAVETYQDIAKEPMGFQRVAIIGFI